ncbi:helix-turn-helix domain-containing protein [Pedobacter gandavensis]|uniref:helix-turn-helix transcriptional regulator n=1 Tax=Pedobacter gandavensis TaxID=2679963 RepID=UPI00292E34CC|nr:helix-turn-helix domain-containing protein [Pedobacter gandavensis]
MQAKRTKEVIYTHADLSSDTSTVMITDIEGLAIEINVDPPTHELIQDHFRSDFLGVFLLIEGEMMVEVNFIKYRLQVNSLALTSPNSLKRIIHSNSDAKITGMSFTTGFLNWLGVSANVFELLEYFTTKFSAEWKLSNEDAALFLELIAQLQEKVGNDRERTFRKELLYHTFYIFLYEMSELGKKYANQVNQILSRKENLMMNFVILVQEQFRTERKVLNYANQLHVTAKYLTETIKEISGSTAGDFIDHIVLLEAKSLLLNPKLSIAEIALQINFSDQSFFGKFFKRLTGQSPKAYRNSAEALNG